jgi:kynurenine formamidase
LRRIDLTYSLSSATPTFPDAPAVTLDALERAEDPETKGRRSLNVTRISLMVHTGTHMDAPFHFFSSGLTIDQVPLEQCIGPALMVDLGDVSPCQAIDLSAIPGLEPKLRRIPKVILNTGWRRLWGAPEYFTDHPCISARSAALLVDCGVHLIGVDMPSVDRPPFPAHLALLGSGIVIVENLTNLAEIGAEEFELAVLPLSLLGRDGSPVRAIASV